MNAAAGLSVQTMKFGGVADNVTEWVGGMDALTKAGVAASVLSCGDVKNVPGVSRRVALKDGP